MRQSIVEIVKNSTEIKSSELYKDYLRVREQTLRLIENLTVEDMVAQSMPDASPIKWHLAHTTWFFETFILQHYLKNFECFNPTYCHLFNSYYVSAGTRHERPNRGLLTRPPLEEVLEYRHRVDEHMAILLSDNNPEITYLATVGLHHEMQHQELMQTDLLHLLSHNPMFPQVIKSKAVHQPATVKLAMCSVDGGLVNIGAPKNTALTDFSYDCEKPLHKVYVSSFSIANRPINNGEWLEFIDDGGYQNPMLWLSDGWACREKNQWQAPLYWHNRDNLWFQYGLDGLQPLELNRPVCHVSYYEADAFARWSGKRLPTEQEWEIVAREYPIRGNFLEQEHWRPQALHTEPKGCAQLFGDVWEWTQSSYSPYPGFEPELGALGEYNGKFMSNQFVLRGGSCVTPQMQMRSTYRNFFYPHHRWQFSGLRLAGDK